MPAKTRTTPAPKCNCREDLARLVAAIENLHQRVKKLETHVL